MSIATKATDTVQGPLLSNQSSCFMTQNRELDNKVDAILKSNTTFKSHISKDNWKFKVVDLSLYSLIHITVGVLVAAIVFPISPVALAVVSLIGLVTGTINYLAWSPLSEEVKNEWWPIIAMLFI